jgi:hypothetical protein
MIRLVILALGAAALSFHSAQAQVSCQNVGATTFCGNGQTFQHMGSTTFDNYGNLWQHTGNTIFGSDGTSCTRIGTAIVCN